jgi:Fe2+ or Zn2+ uptake regulation protein
METIADLVSARTGYSVDAHRVELYGLCPECRQAADPTADPAQPA